MKRLSFHYHLGIRMDAPVNNHRFTLRCIPASDARQQIEQLQTDVQPCDFLSESFDQWGNALRYGCCREEHSNFDVDITGIASTGYAPCVPSEKPERDALFAIPTALTSADSALAEFAAQIPGDGDVLAQSEKIMRAVFEKLRYVPGSTNVCTSAAEAFSLGCGVCQDYSHVMLSVLRAHGIPCRYVVGMLMGEGKSHAWVEVLCDGCWYGFDPTNCQPVTDLHIKLSHGRDYNDCTINRGIFRGNACQVTDICVTVTELK